jgi:hypothetical protein
MIKKLSIVRMPDNGSVGAPFPCLAFYYESEINIGWGNDSEFYFFTAEEVEYLKKKSEGIITVREFILNDEQQRAMTLLINFYEFGRFHHAFEESNLVLHEGDLDLYPSILNTFIMLGLKEQLFSLLREIRDSIIVAEDYR